MSDEDEPHVTWTPNPDRAFCGHGPGSYFKPNGQGGGTLEYKSKTTGRWMKVVKLPYTGGPT